MKEVRALVLSGFGLNCDYETAHAFSQAGAIPVRVHINSLISGDVSLDDFHIIAFTGGFSWGDDHGAGVLQAVRFKTHLWEALVDFVKQKKLVIGICNGFQVLVNLGLLPALNGDYQKRSVALIENDCGNFRDQWVKLLVNRSSPCVFTRDMDRIELPVRHGEGKFYADDSILLQIEGKDQVVLRYARDDWSPARGEFPCNPNGSVNDIAGICDSSGRIFGLMPHPEAYHHPANHPDWARVKDLNRRGRLEKLPEPGTRLFRNAVEYLKNSQGD